MIRVYCTKCCDWYVDNATCQCERPRLRAVEVHTPPPSRAVALLLAIAIRSGARRGVA